MKPNHFTLRAYDATSTTPRVADWERNSYGPNAVLDDVDIGRARVQDAVRNNPWIANALDLLVSHQIGCGIQPRPKIADAGLRRELLALWEISATEIDADGQQSFSDWQTLIARAERESGEVFVRLRPRWPDEGLVVPLQVQALEADLLPIHHNSHNGQNKIRQGIELTPFGKRAAYWFHREHPGDRYTSITLGGLSRVESASVLHHYTPLRPGQMRGTPSSLSALTRARNLDHYESAELTRKKNRAKFNGAITRLDPEGANPITGGAVRTDGDRQLVDIEEGYMLQLAPGESIELYNGDGGNSGAIDFLRTHLRAIAAGMGVPYELMSGDYSGTNDRIMRVILNAFYRRLEIAQERLIHQVLQPIWVAWLHAAATVNAIRIPGYFSNPRQWNQCEWRAHAWSYVNPLQEAQTAVLKIDNGLTSRSAAIAETGWDADDIDAQQAADRKREQALGLQYGVVAPATPLPPETPPEQQEPAPPTPTNHFDFAFHVNQPATPVSVTVEPVPVHLQLDQRVETAPISVAIDPGETHIHWPSKPASHIVKTPIRDPNTGLVMRIEEHEMALD